ncbi:hypothetical protein ACFQZE_06355 [Paenibacillus sp. GCM10027627]|uniref:hypothetical protein n=1 Tax=unclassified Paenibacillus TaxID=185978 RepID=UPI00363F4943
MSKDIQQQVIGLRDIARQVDANWLAGFVNRVADTMEQQQREIGRNKSKIQMLSDEIQSFKSLIKTINLEKKEMVADKDREIARLRQGLLEAIENLNVVLAFKNLAYEVESTSLGAIEDINVVLSPKEDKTDD